MRWSTRASANSARQRVETQHATRPTTESSGLPKAGIWMLKLAAVARFGAKRQNAKRRSMLRLYTASLLIANCCSAIASEPDHAGSWLLQEQENLSRSRLAGGLERSDRMQET